MPLLVERATEIEARTHAIVSHSRRTRGIVPVAFRFESMSGTAPTVVRCTACLGAWREVVEDFLPCYRGWLLPPVPRAKEPVAA